MREDRSAPLCCSARYTPLPTVPPPIIPRFTCCILAAQIAGNQRRGQFFSLLPGLCDPNCRLAPMNANNGGSRFLSDESPSRREKPQAEEAGRCYACSACP